MPANPGVPGPGGIPPPGPVGVEGPGGVLNAGLSIGGGPPPGPPEPKCPFQPGTGSSNVLANVVAMFGATFSQLASNRGAEDG